ncbi:MAG: hypothetical protein J1F11_10795 [Oscillospiraceae bacterium]|nr:hypothetical protein [Oscillospiraceae bacterium]
MKELRRCKGLSGTVLIMILTVMVVLTIMLMATLTVVTTANQRIYTKFEENQAYYSARSALDVFADNLVKDAGYYAYKWNSDLDSAGSERYYTYTKEPADPAGSPTVETAPMKQGLGLQLDLYKIRSQGESAEKQYGNDSAYGIAENAVVGDGTFGTLAATNPEEGNYAMKKSAVPGVPDGEKSMEYYVTFPQVGSPSEQYGSLVEKDDDEYDIAMIKVEVLDRIYATNPAMTKDDIYNKLTTGGATGKQEVQDAIKAGSRSKDYMKIKITSTVTVAGVEGTAVVILETTERNMPNASQALTTSGAASGAGGAAPHVDGGFSTMNTGETKFVSGNDYGLNGTVFTLGSFTTDTSTSNLNLTEGASIIAMKGFNMPSGSSNITADVDGTYIFLGGESSLRGHVGNGSHTISIIADVIATGGSDATFEHYGDIYANTVKLQGGGSNSARINNGFLYTNEVIVPEGTFSTDWEGNLQVSMDCGDLLKNLNIKLNNGFAIRDESGSHILRYDDLSDVKVQNRGKLSDCVNMDPSEAPWNIINFSGEPGVGTYEKFVKDDGKIFRLYKDLPFTLNGDNFVEVPTPQSYYSEYYIEDAFNPDTGDLGLYNSGRIEYTEYDYDTIYHKDNVLNLLKTGAYLFEDYLSDGVEGYTRKNNLGDIIDANSYPVLPASSADKPMVIDLSGGDQIYELSGTYDSQYMGGIKVTGSGGRLILLIREGESVTFNGTGAGFSLETEGCYNGADITNGTTKAPKVDIYGGTESSLTFNNQSTIAGYIMMPTGDITVANGMWSGSYNSDPLDNAVVVGSVLCRKIEGGNKPGIYFLDKNSGADSPGEPHLSVAARQYARN